MASSSLVAAAGESQESKNVSLFDTLLPPGKSSVIKGNTYILLFIAAFIRMHWRGLETMPWQKACWL